MIIIRFLATFSILVVLSNCAAAPEHTATDTDGPVACDPTCLEQRTILRQVLADSAASGGAGAGALVGGLIGGLVTGDVEGATVGAVTGGVDGYTGTSTWERDLAANLRLTNELTRDVQVFTVELNRGRAALNALAASRKRALTGGDTAPGPELAGYKADLDLAQTVLGKTRESLARSTAAERRLQLRNRPTERLTKANEAFSAAIDRFAADLATQAADYRRRAGATP